MTFFRSIICQCTSVHCTLRCWSCSWIVSLPIFFSDFQLVLKALLSYSVIFSLAFANTSDNSHLTELNAQLPTDKIMLNIPPLKNRPFFFFKALQCLFELQSWQLANQVWKMTTVFPEELSLQMLLCLNRHFGIYLTFYVKSPADCHSEILCGVYQGLKKINVK